MTLNLNSLKQTGGVIINNQFSNRNSLLKVIENGENISYQNVDTYSNNFDMMQLKSIKVFINFILPYISYKGKKLGLDSIKNIETLYGGSFGMTIVYNDLVIKISKSTKNNDSDHVKEISGLENLFKNTPDVPSPPDTLSKYYGFMCNKKTLNLAKYSMYSGNMNIYTNLFANLLFQIDEKEIFENAKILGGEAFLTSDFLDRMVIIFLERDDMNLSNFIEKVCNTATPVEKIQYLKYFLTDMREALNYLHRKRFLIHCDIKPDNIVVTKLLTGGYKFKLIDFGSLTPLDKKTGIAIPGSNPPRTPVFNADTYHEKIISFAYDEYCIMFSALMMVGLGLTYDNIFVNNISNDAYKQKYVDGIKLPIILNNIIDKINSKYPKALLLKYENARLTLDARDGYILLTSYILTAPCKGGLPKFI